MNSDTYAFDSESDDDDEVERAITTTKGTHPQAQDINKLKEQTNELLDPVWKEGRNRQLLLKMLELEEPTITAKMVDFLLQDGVCEVLLGFVSQIGTGAPRPSPDDNKAPALKLAYKAVVLLSADEPSEPLLALLGRRASAITRACFEMFCDDSSASFYHAYRILECLLRCFPGDVYDGLCGDGKGAERLGSMLRYVGFAPVGELIVMLICLTPVPRMSQLYIASAKNRWMFFEQISQWIMMLKITEVVVDPESRCFVNHFVDAEQHSSAAAQVLQELIEKLSLEDTGELLLQPLGYTTELLDQLVDTTLNNSVSESRRRSTGRLLCFLLRRAAEPEIMCMMATQPGAPPQPTVVSNRLFPLRERIIVHMETRISQIFDSILAYNTEERVAAQSQHSPVGPGPINFSGYTVEQPFGSLRALLVELMTLMVESDENVGNVMPLDLWKLLMSWTFKYAHNNIFHSFFYRLVFAVLRQGQEPAQRLLFQKAKLTNFLVDNFVPLAAAREELPPKHSSSEFAHRTAIRGVLMNCANAVRLQCACQGPSTFLRYFHSSHQKWTDFLPQLTSTTEFQHRFGMGVKISEVKAANNFSILTLTNEIKLPEEENGIELGSRFAKNLGFFEDVPWSAEADARGTVTQVNPILERQNAAAMSFDHDDDDDEEDSSSSSSDDSDFGEVDNADGDGSADAQDS